MKYMFFPILLHLSNCSTPSKVKTAQSCPTLWDALESPWNSPGQNTGVGSLSFLQGIFPNPGIKLRSLTLQADSLPAEPPGKPKKTGVVSLSLLQGILLTQESNWGLLHCRWILYPLTICYNSSQNSGRHFTCLYPFIIKIQMNN